MSDSKCVPEVDGVSHAERSLLVRSRRSSLRRRTMSSGMVAMRLSLKSNTDTFSRLSRCSTLIACRQLFPKWSSWNTNNCHPPLLNNIGYRLHMLTGMSFSNVLWSLSTFRASAGVWVGCDVSTAVRVSGSDRAHRERCESGCACNPTVWGLRFKRGAWARENESSYLLMTHCLRGPSREEGLGRGCAKGLVWLIGAVVRCLAEDSSAGCSKCPKK